MRGGLVRAYRAVHRLYPRAFRQEYGEDMVLLFADQLDEEPVWRVSGRALVDLVLTVPTRHLEAHMNRSSTPFVVVLFLSLALAGLAFTLVDGVLGMGIAVAGGGLAVLAWHRDRPAAAPSGATAKWWKLLGGGLALLAAVILTTTATGELSEPAWLVAAVVFLASCTLIGTGAVLGLVRLTRRHDSGRLAA